MRSIVTGLLLVFSIQAFPQSDFDELMREAAACVECPADEQIDLYSSAIEAGKNGQSPDSVQLLHAHLERARLYEETMEKQKAVNDYGMASEYRPNDFIPLERKGAVLLEMGKFDQAKGTLRQTADLLKSKLQGIRKMTPYNKEVHGSKEAYEKEIKEASSVYRGALGRVYNNLGIAFGQSGNHTKACEHFRKAIEYGRTSLVEFVNGNCE